MIYLDRIEISNFRTFSPGFAIPLVAPGVTILVGQNGLGKSSIFEAIEWLLTGKVARLEDLRSEVERQSATRTYYVRRTGRRIESNISVVGRFVAPGGEAQEVCREWVRRTGDKFDEVRASPTGEIIELLRDPGWNLPITDLSHYLMETHFLGQPTGGRFTTLDPKERWARFQGPAGFERLARAGDRLGPGTTRALSTLLAEAEGNLRRARVDQEQWIARLRKRDEYRASVSALGALDPSAASEQLRELLRELSNIRERLGLRPLALDAVLNSLQSTENLINEVEEELVRRNLGFKSIDDVPLAWRQQSALKDEVVGKLNELRARIASADGEIRHLQADLEKATAAREEIRAGHSRAEREFESANRAVSAARSLTSAREELQQLRNNLSQCESVASEAAKSLMEAEAAVALARDDERVYQATLDFVRDVEYATTEIENWHTAVAAKDEQERKLRDAQREHEELAGKIAAVEEALREKMTLERSLFSKYDEVRSRNDATKRALSVVVSGIDEHTAACPVCMTKFDESAELLRRALAVLDTDSEVLLSVQKSLSDTRNAVAGLKLELQQLVNQRKLTTSAIEVASRFLQGVEAQRQSVLAMRVLQGVPEENVVSYLAKQYADARERLGVVGDRVARRSNVIDLESRWVAAQRSHGAAADALGRARRSAGAADERVNEIERTIELQREYLAHIREVYGDVELALPVLKRQLDESHIAVSNAVEVCERAKAALAEKLEDRRGRLREQRDLDNVRIESEGRLDGLLRRWSNSGLQGSPSFDVLQVAVEALRQVSQSSNVLKVRFENIRSAMDRWEQARWTEQSVDEYLTEMCRRLDVAMSESELTHRLGSSVEQEAARVQRIGRAKSLAATVAVRIKDETEQYIRRVIAPFNAISDRFHVALSTFPLRRVELLPKTNRRDGTSLYMGVRLRRDASGRDDEGLSASHLLSEGQLSEVAISLLLAMSAVYRWSRWRALLMDDPLQQNDIIHAAAFIDVVRNLVLEEGYQVVVSTHDLSLADFMMRKLRYGGVACSICRFIHPGRVQTIDE
ncbi:AAA family ATPase [Sorangium sp. So ce117]|uniref:AAA family ATPase n=1 Tax=Sorangium sp. So ce117 TaxID=3133277 RepID=UPI003F60C92F